MAAQENGSELLSPTLFNIFLERIICETLDDHEDSVNIGGRLITNFRFADDSVANTEEKKKLASLIEPPQGTKWRSVQKSDDKQPEWLQK